MKKIAILSAAVLALTLGVSANAEYVDFVPTADGMTNASKLTAKNSAYDADARLLHTVIDNATSGKILITPTNQIASGTYNWVKIQHKYSDVTVSETDDSLAYYLSIIDLDEFEDTTAVKTITGGTDMLTEYYDMSGDLGAYGCKEIQFKVADQNRSPKNGKVSAKHDLAYIAFFETEDEAKAYDGSVLEVSIGASKGTVDRVEHTIAVNAELLPGSKVTAPTLTLAKGASAVIPQNADWSKPVEIKVTDVNGKDVKYTVTVTASDYPLPDGMSYEDCIERLNAVNDETYAQLVSDYSLILYNLCPKLENLTPAESKAFWAEAENNAGKFTKDTISDILAKCIEYTEMIKASGSVSDFASKTEGANADLCKTGAYAAWKTFLDGNEQLAVLSDAASAGGYDKFIKTFVSRTLTIAVAGAEDYSELKSVYETCSEDMGFAAGEYATLIASVKNTDTVFYNVSQSIKNGRTDYKAVLTEAVNAQKEEEDAQQNRFPTVPSTSTGTTVSGGGGGMITGKADVIKTEEPEKKDDKPVEDTSDKFPFADCDAYEWAKESINKLYEAGIVSGTDEESFTPSANVTRAEFVVMLARAAGLEPETSDGIFADVTADKWYAPYVNAAVNAGYVSGVSETEFAPDSCITRQDLAVIAVRVLDGKLEDKTVEPTDISEAADYAAYAVKLLCGNGLISGYEDGSFRPYNNATRAETAVITDKIFTLLTAE